MAGPSGCGLPHSPQAESAYFNDSYESPYFNDSYFNDSAESPYFNDSAALRVTILQRQPSANDGPESPYFNDSPDSADSAGAALRPDSAGAALCDDLVAAGAGALSHPLLAGAVWASCPAGCMLLPLCT